MRFYAADGTVFPVRWFFCAPGARVFPHLNAFGSQVWEVPELQRPELGEVDRSLVWDKGINPGFPGLRFQGLPEWFADGIPPDAPPPGPTLCGRPTIYGAGGVEIGGSAILSTGFAITGAGGVLVNGFGIFGEPGTITGQGGVSLGGTADFGTGMDTDAGGVEVGGSAETGSGFEVTAGGVEVGGSGEMGAGMELVGGGGVELDGHGDMAFFIGPRI